MPIKSFRGQLADGAEDTIVLHTIDGSVGYRIVKFQLFPQLPGNAAVENVATIWKVPGQSQGTSGGATIDFNDNRMLACGDYNAGTGGQRFMIVVFDNEIFNQDIYITQTDNNGADALNYYIELEQIKLDLNENTVATLKDIRNNN